MYRWLPRIGHMRPTPVRSLSTWVSTPRLRAIAVRPWKGAGRKAGKSRGEMMPPGFENVSAWGIQTRLSSRPVSRRKACRLRYAPKKTWRPLSSQSPSASCHEETLPPATSRFSRRVTLYPASVRYLAAEIPASPAPAITTLLPACIPLSPVLFPAYLGLVFEKRASPCGYAPDDCCWLDRGSELVEGELHFPGLHTQIIAHSQSFVNTL